MVSASDFRSKRNRTAKFRVLNNVSATSEPSRTRSSTNLRQRPPQMHSTYERKSYSQSQTFPNQPSSDLRTFPQHFADQLRFMKPRQSLNKDINIGHPMQYESLRERADCRWSVEPRTNAAFPSQSTTVMENNVGRAPTKIRTSPALSSPTVQNRQPVTPAIKRHTCDWNVRSKTFQNQFIEKLSPVQRKISLYSTNIKALTSDSALWNETVEHNDNHPPHQRQPCHQFCHLHRHLHKCCTPQITRYRNLKENPPKDNDADAAEPPKNPRDTPKKNKVESASNRNENSKSVERRRRKLKDEDIIRVLELMVNKLVKRGANVDKDLLNELRTSITGSPDEHSMEKRDSSTSSSASSSSTDTTATTSTIHSSESSDRKVKTESAIDDKKKMFRKQKHQQQHQQQLSTAQPKMQNNAPPAKASIQILSSPPLQHKQTELPERAEIERCQRRRAKVDRSSAGSKKSLKHDVCSTGSSGELATWNTKTIKRLKMAVDDLFENILETIRTDHSSVASDLSCDQKDFEVHNSNNNNNNNSNECIDSNKCTTTSLDVGVCNIVEREIDRNTKLKKNTRGSRSFGQDLADDQQLETTETVSHLCETTKSELAKASLDPIGYPVESPVNSTCGKGERTSHKTRRDGDGSSAADVKESFDSHGKPVFFERGCSLDKANQTSSLSLSSNLSTKKHAESPKNFQRILQSRDEAMTKGHVFHWFRL